MNKPEIEFTPVESTAVTPCAGDVAELTERVLAVDPDSELSRASSTSRRLRHPLPTES